MDNEVLMAAQCNFLLCEIWFLKCALGNQAIPVTQQHAEWSKDRGSFQPALMLAAQPVLVIKRKKIKGDAIASISQANTHMECSCYQLCPTCANVIEHQVQILQSGVFLGSKQSRKQWEVFFFFFPKHSCIFQKGDTCTKLCPLQHFRQFMRRRSS